MPDFTHLHCHSTYSFFDGAATIDQLVGRAKELGMKALALTDHEHCYGLAEFQKKCQKAGIKPLLGIEGYIVDLDIDELNRARNKKTKDRTQEEEQLMERARSRAHQILIAKNQTGLENLFKLVSWASTEGKYYKPLFDFKRLKQYSEGLIATSSCVLGIIPAAVRDGDYERAELYARWYKETFGEDFYFEIHDHPEFSDEVRGWEAAFRGWAKKLASVLGVKVICANDTHYLDAEDIELQRIKVSRFIRKNEEGAEYAHPGLTMTSPEEMARRFAGEFPDALDNTMEIAEKCDAVIPKRNFVLPGFEIPQEFEKKYGEKGEAAWIYQRCLDALPKRYADPETQKHAKEQLVYEMKVIGEMAEKQGANFARYFLIVSDITSYARGQGIWVGPGRGSAAGSIVAYLLGITNIDPIAYDLLFERFLNPARVSQPDIDIDFQDDRRQEVIDYIISKYGRESVMQICTIGSLKTRSSIKDVAGYLGIPVQLQNQLSELARQEADEKEFDPNWAQRPELEEFIERDPQVEELVRLAPKVFGWTRQVGVHACAMVITPGPVSDYAPIAVQGSGSAAKMVTQFEGKYVEDAGLLKIDILGLRAGSIMMDAIRMVKENHGVVIDLDAIPLDDPAVYRLYKDGSTEGLFQFESDGMQKWLRKLKPTCLDDLIAMAALYRPGPMDFIPNYIKRKHGAEKVDYINPVFEETLKATYGIPVYQEQVMQMARDMAGFSLGEADLLRRAMGKKIAEEMEEQRGKFVGGAKANKGVHEIEANRVFDIIAEFAKYGFNRSHAAAYALLSYHTGYLKAHYPAEFVAATLEHQADKADEKKKYLQMARRMGVRVFPPSINSSGTRFTAGVDERGNGIVYYGLSLIKHTGKAAVAQILKEREEKGPFADMEDFVRRVLCAEKNKVTSKTVESLIKVGAFDKFGERAELLDPLPLWLDWAEKTRAHLRGRRKSAPAPLNVRLRRKPEILHLATRLRYERELAGYFISGHPLDGYDACQNMLDVLVGGEADWLGISSETKPTWNHVLAYITEVEHLKTRNSRPYARVTALRADDEEVSLIVWAGALERYGTLLKVGQHVWLLTLPSAGYPESIVAVTAAADIVTEWVQWIVARPNDQQELERLIASLAEIPEGSVEVLAEMGGKLFAGPKIRLSPLHLRCLASVTDIEAW